MMLNSRWLDASVHVVRRGGYSQGGQDISSGSCQFGLGSHASVLAWTLYCFAASLRLDLIINRLVGEVIGAVGLLLKIFLDHAKQIPGLSRCSYRRSVRRRVPKYLPLSARGYPRADSSAHPEFSDRRLGSRDRVISPKPAYHGILRSPIAPRDCEQQSAASLGLNFDRSCGEVVTEAL